ncbi:hypothetical protein WJ0W_006384 [Paenibacillus melissococcoides]|uniref:Terminase small subunit n=1 Tax=Paenibacillus melissococcoides TaxID=2912268 RepID=A0ABM9GCQ0_9BACL|nr:MULTISPECIES: hypothetical protein [Paenibacillus]CAH8245117.1 hypothetical protein WJ0W_002347 [Paenibacillus melissococcoides]CAH8249198.1 hypothetical protein WJ0W_006384 [Paenibacillus melissococcoides]CAH8709955.1 hypothetical protein WDD9_002427 [Paenibacillus melissococcoides]CAH8710682.1 hypothetical protein HTL2_002714 [Paenibacillus melissococcoides]GIO81193.1 hypothetical protein J6TS7_48030 [Paenibacillus dendritiformis]
MLEQAKAKLRAEMDGTKDNDYVQFVGQYLLDHIEAHPGDAEKVMVKDKTIAKSLEAMRKAAEKKRKGNVAMLTPQEGFAVVFEYYGIKSTDAASVVPVAPAKVETPVVDDFDVDLDELLK